MFIRLDDGEIRQLTNGPAQAIKPIWSLNDDYILHAAVDSFTSAPAAAGTITGSISPPNRRAVKVYTLAAGSGKGQVDEEYLGWVSDHQMLLHSGRWHCGYFDLRMMNAGAGEEIIFWRGNYHGAAYNSEIGAALVYVDPNASQSDECGPIDHQPGLYLVTIPDNQQTLLDVDPNDLYGYEMTSGEGYGMLFIQSTAGWIGVSADGSTQHFVRQSNLPQEYWELEMDINEIYGWVSPGG